jgi:predicted phosphodiesterase
MSWQNQNINKKVFTIARPLAEEESLLASIPEEAIITALTRNTKTVRVTYVLDRRFITIEDIIAANKMTVKPLKLDRIGRIDNSKRKTKTIKCTNNVLAVLNIADFHLNRLVYGVEAYGDDYNIDIASEVFMRIVEQAIERLKSNPYKIDKIILNTAGDFLNSDTNTGTTAAGTPQVNDLPWKLVFQRATSLLEFALLRLSNIAPVEYFYVRGNHDEQTGFYLTSWLDARFKNVKNVFINPSPKPRQIVNYKQNIIIFTHGESEGIRAMDLPFIEPESIKYISNATNIEVLTGHVHKNKVNNERGVRCESLNSACPVQDNWTYGKAYDGLNQEATIMYYDETGRVQTDYIDTLKILRSI